VELALGKSPDMIAGLAGISKELPVDAGLASARWTAGLPV
jgi:hypothetical protein